jgi:predicted amidohydrolase
MDAVKYVRSFVKRTGEAVVANKDILLGVKLQVGSNMNGRYSYDFLKIARELCDTYRIPLMAHISFAPPETDQVMELMKPGDVVTHCYNRHTLGFWTRRKVGKACARRGAGASCSTSVTAG